MTVVLDQIQTFVEARCGHSFAQRPFDPGFLVADDGSNDLVRGVFDEICHFQYAAVDAGVCALLQVWPNLPLEKATEDHVTSKSLLKIFFNGSGPTLDTLRSPLTVARATNKRTQRCGLPEKESGPTSEPNAKPKRKTAFGPCSDSSSSENCSSGSFIFYGPFIAAELGSIGDNTKGVSTSTFSR